MTKRLNQINQRVTRGFSITELLVSISIIGLLIALVFPVISVMNRSSRVEAGLNVVGMAADVARQWVQAEAWANDASATQPVLEQYSGTAALYCPTGEIRIVINDRNARDGGGSYIEDASPEQNAYKDLAKVDYIKIPNGVGIAGVHKDPGTGAVRFIAPPFAIAFNELGQINYGDRFGNIYYDGDRDGRYTKASTRPAGYSPSTWDEDSTNAEPNAGDVVLKLRFEAIECVSGIVIFNEDEFSEGGFDFDGGGAVTLASNEGQWLKDNGQTVFFSPHTGVVLRDEGE